MDTPLIADPAGFRAAILARLADLDRSVYWLAGRAGLPVQTARDYLRGRSDPASAVVARLAAAAGLRIDLRPDPEYDPGPAPIRGRPKLAPENA